MGTRKAFLTFAKMFAVIAAPKCLRGHGASSTCADNQTTYVEADRPHVWLVASSELLVAAVLILSRTDFTVEFATFDGVLLIERALPAR